MTRDECTQHSAIDIQSAIDAYKHSGEQNTNAFINLRTYTLLYVHTPVRSLRWEERHHKAGRKLYKKVYNIRAQTRK